MDFSEFKQYVITPSDLFRNGHGNGVVVNADNSIKLASSCTFSEDGPLSSPAGIGTDQSDILFVIDSGTGLIYYNCPGTDDTVKVPCIGGNGSEPGRIQFASRTDFVYERLLGSEESIDDSDDKENESEESCSGLGAIAVNRRYILITDTGNRRVQCFFRSSLQIRFIIDSSMLKQLNEKNKLHNFSSNDRIWEHFSPWDCVMDSYGDVYGIDVNSKILFRVSQHGNYAVRVGRSEIADPVSLFLDENDNLYVLDRKKNAVLKKEKGPAGSWSTIVLLETATSNGGIPLGIAVDSNNKIYTGECGKGRELLFHVWSFNGAYAGHIQNDSGCCKRIVSGPGTILYAECAGNGVVKINNTANFTKEGFFFSRVFDGTTGTKTHLWHRINASVDLPPGTSFRIDYIADDNRKNVEAAWNIDDTQWKELIAVYGDDTPSVDALMSHIMGRFLVLRITLGGNGNVTPSLKRIKIIYPHESYLRYLPAVYQEDPLGREITDRFLSLFESFSMDMEEKIGTITRLLDPASVPDDFTPWLASWLGIVKDQNWPEDKFRKFLASAYSLFKIRGTVKGLTEMITLYTGSSVRIIEHCLHLRPMVLGADIRVGISTVVGKKFREPLIIEETSTIGDFTLIEEMDSPEAPFIADAYDFTVFIDAPGLTDTEHAALIRLIDNEKPVNTRYVLRMSSEAVPRIGTALLGMDTRLTHAYQPLSLGERSNIGITSITGTRFPFGGIYGARSQTGIDTYLH